MEESNFELYDVLPEKLWWINIRNDMIKKLLRKYLNKKGRILDLGCGTGFNFSSINKFGKCYGLDISKSALKQAKKFNYKKLYEGNALKTPFKDNVFDAVLCMDLVEHLEEDVELLKEVKRILKPNGICMFTVPAYKFLWSKDDELAHHIRRYTKPQIRKKIKKVGYKILKLSYRYFFIFLPTIMLFTYQKLRKKAKNSLDYGPKKGIANTILKKIGKIENYFLTKINFPFGVGIIGVIKKR